MKEMLLYYIVGVNILAPSTYLITYSVLLLFQSTSGWP